MTSQDWTPLRELIAQHESFLITSHVRPDADALGSELGMQALLQSFGKQVTILNASAPPPILQFMNESGVIRKLKDGTRPDDLPQSDVIVIVDTSAWQQLGAMADVIRKSSARRVVIDHHVSADDLDAVEFRDPSAAATGELVFEAAEALGYCPDPVTAGYLYAAVATDTGWFRFPSTTARTMRVVTQLVSLGASPADVYNRIHEQYSLARLRLNGRVLSRIATECDGRLVWISVSADDLRETRAVPADTESLVNQCLTLGGSEAAFIAVELQSGAVKCSLRCREPHDVARVAEQFGGGGHRLASGATLPGPLAEAISRVLAAMRDMMTARLTAPGDPDTSND